MACGAAAPPAPPRYLSARELGTAESARFPAGDSFVAAHVYRPTDVGSGQLPAVVVGGSLTAVKEQMGGIYAAELARRGFLALSIDYRNYGASGGQVRQFEDPESKSADLSAALDYLGGRDDVASERLGLLGICTSGGTVLYTAAADPRVRAVASVAGHLAEPEITPSLYGGADGVAARQAAARAAAQRYRQTGENQTILAYHDQDQSASHPGPNEYYMDTGRGGGVSQWRNEFAVMSWEPWLAFDPVSKAAAVTAPALVVHSDDCALPDQARKTYDLLAGPKNLHWTEGPHFEFYDGTGKVAEAVDIVAEHFARSL
ncbi:alpha/beta hydrolase [Mycobacterium manitobense]|uniref:Alpha/beta hydrolase n=1 Tax=[Mycobacterium] manitobense TaxID=190147 RepID=A0A9X2YJI2_9MYCO|nr:alpha/beta hydrolase [[Mycobacterium] manitobense]MCV7168909.1 alpha/beta hydrolase [[Mycobacterium] manitobense]